MYEWLLFFHVVAAFMVVIGLAAYGVVAFTGAAPVRAALAPAVVLWNVGAIGVLVFGVWLAINVDGYEVWDGWVIAAFVLWLVAGAAGGRLERSYRFGSPAPLDRVRAAAVQLNRFPNPNPAKAER